MTPLLLSKFSILLVLANCAHFSNGQLETNTVISVTSPAPLTTCEPITEEIPTCINVGWSNTSFPNLRSHRTQAEAYQELEDFDPLIQSGCSNKIVHFLCAVYAPICLTDAARETIVLEPCRSLCEYVRRDCEPVLDAVGYAWPTHLNCDRFPAINGCVEVSDDVVIPAIPGLVVDPPRTTTSITSPSSVSISLGIAPSPSVTKSVFSGFVPYITTSSLTITSSSTPTPSPIVEPPICDGFLDEERCVESCNSQKYIVDNSKNVFANPDYRVVFGNLCLKSCPDGYVDYMGQCIANCPGGFLKVSSVCEECIGDCVEDVAATAPNAVEVTGPFVTWSAPGRVIGSLTSYVMRVSSATGDGKYVMKNATSFSHILSSSDIPSNLGGQTSVTIQVRVVTSYGFGEWSEEHSLPVTALVISDLIPTLNHPEPKISLINNSPLVTGRSVTVYLAVNHPFSVLECRLSSSGNVQLGDKEQFRNCSSGMVTYEDLPDAVYKFHARSQLLDGGHLITMTRKFRPDNNIECSAHLINNGVTVSGNTAVVEFAFFGDYTRCKLDDENFRSCSSPYLLTNLSPGRHSLKITPQICLAAFRYPLKVYFDV